MHYTDRFIPARPNDDNYFALHRQNENQAPNRTPRERLADQAYRNAVLRTCGISETRVLSYSNSAARAAHPATQYVEEEERVARESALFAQVPTRSPKCIKLLDAPDLVPHKYATHIDIHNDTLAASLNNGVYVMRLMSRDEPTPIPNESLEGLATCVHWVGENVFVGCDSGAYSITDLHYEAAAPLFKDTPGSIVSATSSSRNPFVVYFTTNQHEVVASDIRQLNIVTPTALHTATVTSTAMNSDGIHLATADEAGLIATCDIRNLQQVSRYNLQAAVTDLQWNSANPDLLYSAGGNKLVALAPIQTDAPVCQMDVDGSITGITVSGSELAVSQNGLLRVLNSKLECLANCPTDESEILDVCSGSRYTVTISANEIIRIWEDVFSPPPTTRKPYLPSLIR